MTEISFLPLLTSMPVSMIPFVRFADLSGRKTIARVTGDMKVNFDGDEASPYFGCYLKEQDFRQYYFVVIGPRLLYPVSKSLFELWLVHP